MDLDKVLVKMFVEDHQDILMKWNDKEAGYEIILKYPQGAVRIFHIESVEVDFRVEIVGFVQVAKEVK